MCKQMSTAQVDPKIPFTVCRCSSEDAEHPSTELNTMSPHTSGWISQRFCEFPQEVVLQLHSAARVRQIQVLSHHESISQRIEIFVGSGHRSNPEACRFDRLGYISLDSNERSRFQARELGEGLGAATADAQAKAREVEVLTEQTKRDADALAAAAEAAAAAQEAMRVGAEERAMLTTKLEKEIALRSNLEMEMAKVAAERTAKVRACHL